MMSSGSQTPTCRVTACSRCRWAGPEQPEGPAVLRRPRCPAAPTPVHRRRDQQGRPPEFPVARRPQSVPRTDEGAAIHGAGRQVSARVRAHARPDIQPDARCLARRRSPFRRRWCRTGGRHGCGRWQQRKPVPTGATGRDRFSAASMMPGCASRTVGRWRTPLRAVRLRCACVAARMPPRYVPRVNDERNVRATCEVSNSTHIQVLRGVWCSGRARHRTTR
jgi:hypothetical protein